MDGAGVVMLFAMIAGVVIIFTIIAGLLIWKMNSVAWTVALSIIIGAMLFGLVIMLGKMQGFF